MSITATVHVTCEKCGRTREGRTSRAISSVGEATLEARMAAQEAGWQTRRNHGGADLCPTCREAVA